MAFNHDTRWKSNALSKSLKDFGDDLIRALSSKRETLEEKSRPIILIGHSFGGLIIDQCVVNLLQRGDSDRELLDSLLGLVFLGTPHRGSKLTPLGEIISLFGYWRGSDTTLLKVMKIGSKTNDELRQRMFTFIKEKVMWKRTLCIYETEREKLWGLPITHVVDRNSAVIEGTESFSAETSHKEMQRYESEVDETYEDMMKYLKGWLKDESERQNAMQKKPAYIYSVPPKTVPSYTQRDQLWNDMERKLNLRHEEADIPYAVVLHGLGGSGKSQLALKYAESKRDQFNPVLWIDATNEELFRSSFARCATEIGLSDDRKPRQNTKLRDDPTIRSVLQWLYDRTEEKPEWLVIFDNVDDFTWDIQNVIPAGIRGRIIITSQDTTISKRLRGGCEKIHIDSMSPREASMVLFQHLWQGHDPPPEKVQQGCDEVAEKLGYLALAVDLAGAYMSDRVATPEQALMQYLRNLERHRDELLQKDEFQGLSKERKTIWTVWDTTLEKIERENTELPVVLLSFLAHFRGSIVRDEVFRLASFGIFAVDDELGEDNSTELRMFIPQDEEGWERFRYDESIDVLARYSLVQRVQGVWPGTTMHKLVQWRATRDDKNQQWQGWYVKFMLAACFQLITEDHRPEFRRHLMLHFPDVRKIDLNCIRIEEAGKAFIWGVLWNVYHDEGRWEEAEWLQAQVMETRGRKLGQDHPDMLGSMANLALTYKNQGRWKVAEQLQLQVMKISKTKLGEDHPDTLRSMGSLALTYKDQGRWKEAEQLQVQVMETRRRKLNEDHPDILGSMANLAAIYKCQGRWKVAEQLQLQVMKISKTKLDKDHPYILGSMASLAATYKCQGRWKEAEQLQLQVMKISKTKLGEDHLDTLRSMGSLALTYKNQDRWKEAEKLQLQVMETYRRKLSQDHPDMLASMGNLALTYQNQGRWKEAEKLQLQVIEIGKTKLDEDHPDMLGSIANLAAMYGDQGRWKEAEQLQLQVMEICKTKLGEDHPDTLRSMSNLELTYKNKGLRKEVKKLQFQ